MDAEKIRSVILQKIGSSSGAERKALAKLIIENQIPVTALMEILERDHPISTRFSWLFSDLCDLDKNLSPTILNHIFKYRRKSTVLNIERVIAKQAFLSGLQIPEEIEGEVIDWLFEQYANPKIQPSIRFYVEKAIKNLVKKYPDLQNEFDLMH